MRFMIVVKATKDTEAGNVGEEKMFAAMTTYHEELAKAGVLLDASGLQPAAVPKLRRMISFLQDMSTESELRAVSS